MDAVLNRISAAGRADPIHLIVDYLCLMSYDTRNICGPLTTLARYDLRHNTLHWIAPHPVLNPSVPFQPHEGYDAETFLPDPGVKGVA